MELPRLTWRRRFLLDVAAIAGNAAQRRAGRDTHRGIVHHRDADADADAGAERDADGDP